MLKLRISSAVASAAAILMLATAGIAQAHEEGHEHGSITGTGIHLHEYDHAFAGQIGEKLVWGDVNEATTTFELRMRHHGQTIVGQYALDPVTQRIGGLLEHRHHDQVTRTAMEFVRVDREAQQLHFTLNGEAIVVSITADGFANHHFANPTYKTVIAGKEVSFTLKGHACYKYSVGLSFLILSALAH